MRAHLVPLSRNRKTGPIPVSTTEHSSCPPSCGLAEFCYGLGGPVALNWKAVSEGRRGKDWSGFCEDVSRLPRLQLWRHNAVGDLPGEGDELDEDKCLQLAAASRGKRGFTFTHYPMTARNASIVGRMNEVGGLVVNLSADSLAEADEKYALGVGPVAVVIPKGVRNVVTPAGHHVALCPADHHEHMNCSTCGLCAIGSRKAIVGFTPKGSRRNRLQSSLESNA